MERSGKDARHLERSLFICGILFHRERVLSRGAGQSLGKLKANNLCRDRSAQPGGQV